jgi:hypothetical protein
VPAEPQPAEPVAEEERAEESAELHAGSLKRRNILLRKFVKKSSLPSCLAELDFIIIPASPFMLLRERVVQGLRALFDLLLTPPRGEPHIPFCSCPEAYLADFPLAELFLPTCNVSRFLEGLCLLAHSVGLAMQAHREKTSGPLWPLRPTSCRRSRMTRMLRYPIFGFAAFVCLKLPPELA